jgi:uncharacterized protein YkwD
MKNIKAFFVILIMFLAGFLIYFKPDLTSLRYKAQEKLSQMESGQSENISSSMKKQIYAPPPLKSGGTSEIGSLTKSGTIRETNIQRRNNSVVTLKENKKLDEAATAKAKDILEKQYFDHVSPTGSGPADLADKAGFDYIVIGENLALGGFRDDIALVEAWMNSPGHRENILNSGFREIGVATIKGEYEGRRVWVAVQEFGTASSYCPAVDLDLKKTLENDQKKINTMKEEIDQKKKDLDSIGKKDRSLYNSAVNSYNALVEQYNNLVGEAKAVSKKLNSQIENYNSCLKEYSKT